MYESLRLRGNKTQGETVDMITVNSTVALDLYLFNNLALGLFDFTDALY